MSRCPVACRVAAQAISTNAPMMPVSAAPETTSIRSKRTSACVKRLSAA
jgi:hypothetical protein